MRLLLNDAQWLPASEIARVATLRDSIAAKTRTSSETRRTLRFVKGQYSKRAVSFVVTK